MYKFYAVLVGVFISIMVTFNGTLDNYLGNTLSVLIIHIVGLISISFVLILKKGKPVFSKEVPYHLYSGGAIGILLVLVNNICYSNLGASLTLSLGVLGQLLLSSTIDHFGWLGMNTYKFHKKKIIGFIIILIGIIIMTTY